MSNNKMTKQEKEFERLKAEFFNDDSINPHTGDKVRYGMGPYQKLVAEFGNPWSGKVRPKTPAKKTVSVETSKKSKSGESEDEKKKTKKSKKTDVTEESNEKVSKKKSKNVSAEEPVKKRKSKNVEVSDEESNEKVSKKKSKKDVTEDPAKKRKSKKNVEESNEKVSKKTKKSKDESEQSQEKPKKKKSKTEDSETKKAKVEEADEAKSKTSGEEPVEDAYNTMQMTIQEISDKCKKDKKFEKSCTSEFWQLKFKHDNLPVMNQCVKSGDWIKEYKDTKNAQSEALKMVKVAIVTGENCCTMNIELDEKFSNCLPENLIKEVTSTINIMCPFDETEGHLGRYCDMDNGTWTMSSNTQGNEDGTEMSCVFREVLLFLTKLQYHMLNNEEIEITNDNGPLSRKAVENDDNSIQQLIAYKMADYNEIC